MNRAEQFRQRVKTLRLEEHNFRTLPEDVKKYIEDGTDAARKIPLRRKKELTADDLEVLRNEGFLITSKEHYAYTCTDCYIDYVDYSFE